MPPVEERAPAAHTPISGPRDRAGVEGGAEDRLPRRFGQYQLFDRIGKGGMATIYLARMETGLGAERLVVVKEIHEALSKDSSFSTQFVDEAKLCAGLRHANIAQVVDLGRAEHDRGVLFMAMEYVEGFDLQQLLRRLSQTKLPLQPEFAFHIVRETLTGLDFAHRATGADGRSLGIVHRDVSPSNVLISLEGEVKLCDFGIAKAYGRAGEMGLGDEDGATTESGHDAVELGSARVVGKSAYMAPEHARGETLDARADVFAAGILLWEMCAGRRLYKGSEAQMLELARRAEIPRLPARGLPGHDELQALLDRALSPDRDARFPTAKAMLDALDDYLAKHRLLPSQLRFAAFLTDHFGEELVAERRAREVSAREAAISHPPAAAEPAEAARPRRFPMPDLDLDDAEAKTVLKPAPRPPGSAPSPSTSGALVTAQAPATPETSASTRTLPKSAPIAPTPPPTASPAARAEPVNTAHLGMAALVLMLVAALLGAGLFYLLVR